MESIESSGPTGGNGPVSPPVEDTNTGSLLRDSVYSALSSGEGFGSPSALRDQLADEKTELLVPDRTPEHMAQLDEVVAQLVEVVPDSKSEGGVFLNILKWLATPLLIGAGVSILVTGLVVRAVGGLIGGCVGGYLEEVKKGAGQGSALGRGLQYLGWAMICGACKRGNAEDEAADDISFKKAFEEGFKGKRGEEVNWKKT
jgi:hypothetical protein